MDSTEFNQYRPLDPRLFKLPKIISLKMKLIDFKAPKLKTFTSRLSKYKRAIEITIVTDSPIPIRNIAPAIYIGNALTIHSEEGKAKNEYKFYIFDFEKLKQNEPILWGWVNEPPANRISTGFNFDMKMK